MRCLLNDYLVGSMIAHRQGVDYGLQISKGKIVLLYSFKFFQDYPMQRGIINAVKLCTDAGFHA